MKNSLALSIAFFILFYNITLAQQKKIREIEKSFLQNKKTNYAVQGNEGGYSIQSVTAPYTFSSSNGSYTNLTGSTSLNAGITWDDPSYSIPIGFNFTLWNTTVSSIELGDLGGWLIKNSGNNMYFIMNACDLIDRASDTINWDGMPGSLSNISYLLSGSPGSRIFKVEWNNAGFYDEVSAYNTSTNFVNMQMWLYEGSNNIEIRFGPSSIAYPSLIYYGDPGPVLGVGYYDGDIDSAYIYGLQGPASAPTAVLSDSAFIAVTGSPPNGIIYKFSWFFVGINEFEEQNKLVDIYPNPASERTTLLWRTYASPNHTKIEAIDVLGRTVFSTPAFWSNERSTNIDLGSIEPGSYTLKIISEDKIIYKKLIKQ